MRRSVTSTFLAVAIALGPAADCLAQGAGAELFEAELESVQEALREGLWVDAEQRLRALLIAYSGADYVRPHLEGLRADLKRAVFWQEVAEPDPKTLVSGKLFGYGRGSGEIRIQYTSKTLGDFERSGASYSHPMHFRGAWTLEVEGTLSEVQSTAFFVALEPGDGYLVRFGKREKNSLLYFKHTVSRVRGDQSEQIASEDPIERKGAVTAKISVGKKSITLSYAGRTVLRIDKPEEGFGSPVLIVQGRLGSARVTLDGPIDHGWIGGLVDAAVSDQRKAFEAAWRDPPELAPWSVAAEAQELGWRELLGSLRCVWRFERPGQEELFEKAHATLGKGRAQALSTWAQLETLPSGVLPAGAAAYLRFVTALELERPSLALDHLQDLEFAHGQDLERDLLEAELLLAAGRKAEALAASEAIASARPEVSMAHEQSARTLLLMGRADEAHRAVLRGLAAQPASASLRSLEVKVVKAARGPPWKRVHEHVGEHFVVRTDVNPKLARDACQVLDQAWERCIEYFTGLLLDAPRAGTTGGAPAQSLAFLFSGEASYLAYVEGFSDSGHENTLGLYSTHLKQIAAWNQPNVNDLWDTLRHEVAHRYLDVVIGERIPRWLSEGLAESFAACWAPGGGFEPGRLRERALDHLRAMGRKKLEYPRDFWTQTEQQFLARVELNYALSWAQVHFLRFASEVDRERLLRVLADLQAGVDPNFALDEALGPLDLDGYLERFVGWMNATLRPREER